MNVTHLRSDLYQLTDIVDGLLCLDIFEVASELEVGAERRLKNTTTTTTHGAGPTQRLACL